MLRFKVFTDPFYHSDNEIEFHPDEVVAIQQKTLRLFLRGRYEVTYVTLRNGAEHALVGDVADQIRAAQAQTSNNA